ncbi:aspartate aminotransferase family protein [Candidatus Poribacteria bacterium]|nr:aspartate aminotransferase family protein [Candidatus Poribacteria bacterium]
MNYRDILAEIRLAFPQPVADPIHNSYFVHSIMRALDQVDALKTQLPMLGSIIPADFEAARQTVLPDEMSSIEDVTDDLVSYLRGMTIFGHPQTQQNVIPPPTIPSLIGVLLASLYNPNLAWDEFSRLVAVAEVEIIGMISQMIGYDPEVSSGVFTFGGTGTTLYGVKFGLEKACPGTTQNGISEDAVVFVSDAGHYCATNIVGWLGIGTNNLVTIPTTSENEIDLDQLEQETREVLASGKKIAAILATLGTTDAFGLDDLESIVTLRDTLVNEFQLDYRPHIHADAVIGWAWSVFNDYNFEENPLGFRPRTLRALAGAGRRIRYLSLADSIGIDFHKTGFAPYISSLVLVKNEADLGLVTRQPEQMPYLYHYGDYKPGMYTLETSRAGTGPLAALANLRLFGQEGLQTILGHIVEMTQRLREHLEGHEGLTVLNRDNFGTVTVFRAYPVGVDTFSIKREEFEDPANRENLLTHNAYNREIFEYVHTEAMEGRGVVISTTDCYRHTAYGEPIVGLKSYILSPFVDETDVETVVAKVLEAREKVGLVQNA